MKVVLAGYNVDARILDRTTEREGECVTPEVISASYARVSRDPRRIATLRKEALGDVAKARRSNERIVFGLGHASIAEHAVLNFDVSDVSRLAVESIERFRLASFTEKSQRYCQLERDFVVPEEIIEAGLEKRFRTLLSYLHYAYRDIQLRMRNTGHADSSTKEDARYVMPLAAATQLGMTVNARELEYMIMRLGSHPIAELRDISKLFFEASRRAIPSLIRYPEPTEHWKDEREARKFIADDIKATSSKSKKGKAVNLLSATENGDRLLAACMIFASCGCSMEEARDRADSLTREALRRTICAGMRRLGPHDAVWREFECVEFLFELLVSASCFAQLKRHRMATILAQPYDLSLGVSIPASVAKAGAVGIFKRAVERAERFYERHIDSLGPAAEYILLNAHRRRVIFRCNLRELYHLSRLRSDASAQWEIRAISDEMCRLAEDSMPIGAALLCGKDSFEEKKALFDSAMS